MSYRCGTELDLYVGLAVMCSVPLIPFTVFPSVDTDMPVGYDGRVCRFDLTPVEPMSHTILNGVCRTFICFIISPDCPTKIDGKQFRLPASLVQSFDDAISRITLVGSYRRAACKILQ